jgi:N-acetylglutamate synthase
VAAASVTIRRFALDDYDAVASLWDAAGLPFKSLGRDSRPAIAAELQLGLGVFLVAETLAAAREGERPAGGAESQIVGVVFGTHDGRKGWINRLAVTPNLRGQGIARRLVSQVETELRALGIDVIAALIESDNQASRAFFAHIGYVHDPAVEYFSTRAGPHS